MIATVAVELAKVLLTILMVKFLFELFQAIESIGFILTRPLRRISRRRMPRSACCKWHHFVYPSARFLVKERETCCICLCQRTDAVLQCGHPYHWDCVNVWLDANNTCPICRAHQCRWVESLL
jgi:hypothetical protein